MGTNDRWRLAVRPASGPVVAWRVAGPDGSRPCVPAFRAAGAASPPEPRRERAAVAALLLVSDLPPAPDGTVTGRGAWLVRPVAVRGPRRVWCRSGLALYPAGVDRAPSVSALAGGGAAAVVPSSGVLRELSSRGWVSASAPWAETVAAVACGLCRAADDGGPGLGRALWRELVELGAWSGWIDAAGVAADGGAVAC